MLSSQTSAILAFAVFFALSSTNRAANFHPISSATTTTPGDLYPVSNLIQGPGSGFGASEPHNKLGGGATHTWVTYAPAADWYSAEPAPVLVFDLGSNRALSEISTWGYADTNTNGAKDFTLRFATSAEGTAGFGSSITYAPSFEAAFQTTARDSHSFSQTVTARYVEMTITDNWRGFQGGTPGGDRVGLGEVAFEDAVPPIDPQIDLPANAQPRSRRLRANHRRANWQPRRGANAYDLRHQLQRPQRGRLLRDERSRNDRAGGLDHDPVELQPDRAERQHQREPHRQQQRQLDAKRDRRHERVPLRSKTDRAKLTALRKFPHRCRGTDGIALDIQRRWWADAKHLPRQPSPALPPRISRSLRRPHPSPHSAGAPSSSDSTRWAMTAAYSAQLEIASNDALVPTRIVNLTANVGDSIPNSGLRINEFMASNGSTIDDGDSNSSDWIEIFNAGPGSADLSGWHLTDSAGNLDAWEFPPGTMLAENAYLLVFASRARRRQRLHRWGWFHPH